MIEDEATLKVSEVIAVLQKILENYGDLEVYHLPDFDESLFKDIVRESDFELTLTEPKAVLI